MMRAMTTKLPWAWLIVNGYKEYELAYATANMRELIAIRASTVDEAMVRHVRKEFPEIPLPPDEELTVMQRNILGTAKMTDCVPIAELSDVAEGACCRRKSYGNRKNAWVLAGAAALQQPIHWMPPLHTVIWSHLPPAIEETLRS